MSGALNRQRLVACLRMAYPDAVAEDLASAMTALVGHWRQHIGPRPQLWVDQSDAMLITYGDSLLDGARRPLEVLRAFLATHVGESLGSVHILPCYPFSSDDGFSVIDFRAVNPVLGDWRDVEALGQDVSLMLDGVINHVSQESTWFQAFLEDDPTYVDWFITGDPGEDLSMVTRPRATPLLTPVQTASGTKYVWTTFSADQVDLNYETPAVLLEILDMLLFYAAKGARFIRLDAIGFLWKRLGTTCMHLPETHALIQVMRQVMDAAAPGTLLITETNVPHKDNISYFGDGGNEAHMVYQFPLPPLTMHAFQTGDARVLSSWAASLEPTTATTAYFNFLASHDGIGVRPVEGILSSEEVAAMAARVEAAGGLVSMRALPDGSTAPYELNIAFMDAISPPEASDARRAAAFLATHTILLSLMGMPAIYIHSLLGSRSDRAGVARTGRNRSINRAQLDVASLERELADEQGLRRLVLDGLKARLARRKTRPAFHPNAAQRVLDLDHRVFSVVREGGGDRVWAVVNVSDQTVTLSLEMALLGFAEGPLRDLIAGHVVAVTAGTVSVTLAPYQDVWLVT